MTTRPRQLIRDRRICAHRELRARAPRPAAAVVVAVDDQRLRRMALWAVRRAGHVAQVVEDRAALLERVAGPVDALILGDELDCAPAHGLIAMMRGAGCDVPVLVVSAAIPDPLLARASLLEPIAFLRDPCALGGGHRVARQPGRGRRRWLQRCVELALPDRCG